MAVLRIRVELHRPSKGIEMSKLADFARETQKFLRMVAEDVGLNPNEGTWIAQDFYNQSLGFDAEYQLADIDHEQATAYAHAVGQISEVNQESNWAVRGIKPVTVFQFAKVATLAASGEAVRFGLYQPDQIDVEWRTLQKDRAVAIIEHYQEWIEYRGMIQGIIHTLFKEANPPHFLLRDLASRDLVKCVFRANDYAFVYKTLERKDGVVLVSGWIRARRLDRTIDELRVERLQPTTPLNIDQLKDFFGSAPGWTADLTADEFIDIVRKDRDGDE